MDLLESTMKTNILPLTFLSFADSDLGLIDDRLYPVGRLTRS